MLSTNLKQRLVYGLLGIIIYFISINLSYTPYLKSIFILINAVIITSALREYYKLAEGKGFQPLFGVGLICTFAYTIAVYFSHAYQSWHFVPPLILFILLILGFLSFFNKESNPLINLAITLFGIAYLTIPLSFGLKINYFPFQDSYADGRLWLTYAFVVTKMTDTGAFFFGKNFGKHKLVPHISPKKTVEGALGGLLTSVLTSILFYFIFKSPNENSGFSITLIQSIWLGVSISVLAQFGDLAESILKRDAGVKDSSRLPGLGGMLDVFDSLVFTLPFMYFILKMNFLG